MKAITLSIFSSTLALLIIANTKASIIISVDIYPQLSAGTQALGSPPDYDSNYIVSPELNFSYGVGASSGADGATSSVSIAGTTNHTENRFHSSFSTSATYNRSPLAYSTASSSFVWQIRIESDEDFIFSWDQIGDLYFSSDIFQSSPIFLSSTSVQVVAGSYWLAPLISFSGSSENEDGSYSYSGEATFTYSPVSEPSIINLMLGAGTFGFAAFLLHPRCRTWRCS